MNKPGRKEYIETGILIAAIVCLEGVLTRQVIYFKSVIVILLLILIYPMLFKPIAIVWFGVSHWMGKFSSFILLSVVYYVLLLPVGLILQLSGKDLLIIKKFKRGRSSVFVTRNKTYNQEDLIKPY